MPRSEIDEIFAATPKKKAKTSPAEQQAKSSRPESVQNPYRKPAPSKRREKKHTKDEEARFKDSRGSVPRRKTADGYAIYKEDELGISTTGGGEQSIHPPHSVLNLVHRQTLLFVHSIASAVFNVARQVVQKLSLQDFAGLALAAVVWEVNV